ncbi:MAG: hypothetical protein GYA34_18640 [Chloroflexi bacterium]|nr:hypothetical protein [Chloroflexota bacterium]
MLEQILKEFSSGNSLNISRLAARLNSSPEMVTAMLDHLASIGVLESIECSAQSCKDCLLVNQCRSNKPENKLWKYKAKR